MTWEPRMFEFVVSTQHREMIVRSPTSRLQNSTSVDGRICALHRIWLTC